MTLLGLMLVIQKKKKTQCDTHDIGVTDSLLSWLYKSLYLLLIFSSPCFVDDIYCIQEMVGYLSPM